jgi:hypothetical protein
MDTQTANFTGNMVPGAPSSEGAVMVDEISQFLKDEAEKQLDFNQARQYLDIMLNDWKDEEDKTLERRKLRKVEINIEEERNEGNLGQDETIIPVRVIDTNIRREQPPFVSYLKQSRRLAVFKVDAEPGLDTQQVETAFTNGMTYENWETPLYKTLDGAQTHGWDSVEIVYDKDKPLAVGIEHIGHDRLIFPKDAISIQHANRLIRRYDITITQLIAFTESFGFNREQVILVLNKYKERNTGKLNASTIKVYKVFFRINGVVHTAWFADRECGTNDWLKNPTKLELGISRLESYMEMGMQIDPMSGMPVPMPMQKQRWVPADVRLYPVFCLPYAETEEDPIFSYKGRVFLDQYMQEAQTYITSGYVNAIGRASNLYAAVEGDDGSSAAIKQVASLESGVILNKAIRFFQPEYPDASVVSALQYLSTSNANETGQVAWAVNNREDSRKTATEIGAAQQQQSLLNSVQLTLFSTFIRQIYSFAWQIVKSQALQNNIQFLLDPQTGMNRTELVDKNYSIRAAGDIDVVQRAEKLAEMKQFWPIVAGTPAALPFLTNMLKLAFPDDGEKYEMIMQQGDIQKAIIQQMYGILAALGDEVIKGLPPQQQQNFMMLMQQAQQVLGQQGQQEQPQQQSTTQQNGQPSSNI